MSKYNFFIKAKKHKYRVTVPLKERYEKSTGRMKVASAAAVVTA
jgi:hypothetical protein